MGYLLTANQAFADAVRTELHVWNINSFAESFLRQAPRWRKAFRQSCALVRAHCDELYEGLNEIPGMTAYRPQANFVMCRLPAPGPSGPVIAKRLFMKHNIFVKHCAGKHMSEADRYLRIASKTAAENQVLVEAMRQCLVQ